MKSTNWLIVVQTEHIQRCEERHSCMFAQAKTTKQDLPSLNSGPFDKLHTTHMKTSSIADSTAHNILTVPCEERL